MNGFQVATPFDSNKTIQNKKTLRILDDTEENWGREVGREKTLEEEKEVFTNNHI